MSRVFFVSGEISGDTHGAALMRNLRTVAGDDQFEFAGLGGHLMREAGGDEVEDWVTEAGVVGLWEVLKKYGWFKQKFDATLARIAEWKPDAVVLIDYPGFNLRLARTLRKAKCNAKVIYYISPQVWAWNRGRIPKMARMLDLMLCIFPFEKELYEASGLRTEFVGHPFGDEMEHLRIATGRESNLVGFLPGSREREVAALFPVMREAAIALARQFPELRFEVAAASDARAAQIRDLLAGHSCPEIQISVGQACELMQRATVGVVASGTASLQAAFFGLPYCLVYRVAPLTYLAARAVMKVEHLGMVNILAGREVVRELLQNDCTACSVSEALAELLQFPARRNELSAELAAVTAPLTEPGASKRAANVISRAILETS
ncbi:MAG: lipid-A-disaccharide synthase [Verrucomicrobiae bacterium]|nr:lipid-A-disaccharide synthase [Verrucomicrobiae bacterium]